MNPSRSGSWRRLLGGLARTARGLGWALALTAAAALAALLIVYPLWYFSSRSSRGYTVFVLSALTVLIVFLIARRLMRRSRSHGGLAELARSRILPALRTAGIVAAVLAGIYGIVLLAARLFG